MIKGERLFQAGRTFSSSQVELASGSVPFQWQQHPEIQPNLDSQLGGIVDEVPNCLGPEILPGLMPQLLAQKEVLDPTIRTLFPNQDVEVAGLKGLHLQAGRKAYILLCEAITSRGLGHFVIYLSRGPSNSTLGEQAVRDFGNLKELGAIADSRLVASAKKQYKVIEPIALGTSPAVNGFSYPFFTMPFIEDYGELRIRIYQDLETGITMPYYSFAFPYNQAMMDYCNKAEKIGPDVKKEFLQMRRRFPQRAWATISDSLYYSPPGRKLRQQIEDLLVGNALIYLLSGRRFPREFMVNAGDWMMSPKSNDGLNLFLTTVRGGWGDLGNDESAWIELMRRHEEPVPGREAENLFFPLFNGFYDLIPQSLEKAKRLLRE